MKALRVSFAALACLLASTSASGHVPETIEAEREHVVERPRRSTALYGEFESGQEVFTIVLDYSAAAFALPFEILVPVDADFERHRPMFAVVGPGLPPPTDEELALLPRELPEGAGVFLERNDVAERPQFYERFSDTTFWTSEPTALALEQAEYEVWVFSPDGTTGKFTLGFGVEEQFSLADIIALLFAGDRYSHDP